MEKDIYYSIGVSKCSEDTAKREDCPNSGNGWEVEEFLIKKADCTLGLGRWVGI